MHGANSKSRGLMYTVAVAVWFILPPRGRKTIQSNLFVTSFRSLRVPETTSSVV